MNEIFFLCCVIIAGVFGVITANRKILCIQAMPGALAPVTVVIGYS